MERFENIPVEKLRAAVVKMVEFLDLPGGSTSYYDLYEAVIKEQRRAKERIEQRKR